MALYGNKQKNETSLSVFKACKRGVSRSLITISQLTLLKRMHGFATKIGRDIAFKPNYFTSISVGEIWV